MLSSRQYFFWLGPESVGKNLALIHRTHEARRPVIEKKLAKRHPMLPGLPYSTPGRARTTRILPRTMLGDQAPEPSHSPLYSHRPNFQTELSASVSAFASQISPHNQQGQAKPRVLSHSHVTETGTIARDFSLQDRLPLEYDHLCVQPWKGNSCKSEIMGASVLCARLFFVMMLRTRPAD